MITLDKGLDVLRIITRHDSANPITGEQVAILTGWDPEGRVAGGIPPREIAEVVSLAVSRGVRVVSNGKGYFRPSEEEVRDYLDRERRRLLSLAMKVSRAKRHVVNELSLFEQEAE